MIISCRDLQVAGTNGYMDGFVPALVSCVDPVETIHHNDSDVHYSHIESLLYGRNE